jgi:hypothetical protein
MMRTIVICDVCRKDIEEGKPYINVTFSENRDSFEHLRLFHKAKLLWGSGAGEVRILVCGPCAECCCPVFRIEAVDSLRDISEADRTRANMVNIHDARSVARLVEAYRQAFLGKAGTCRARNQKGKYVCRRPNGHGGKHKSGPHRW